jgi:hypothetical protein
MYWRLVGVVVGMLLWGVAPLSAQEGAASEAYGSGVHAFFSGEYQQAHDLLSGAIKSGTKDPRFFYYRGLALLKLGREDDAAADFQGGAKLETVDLDGMYNISRALERIQGADRRILEKHRAEARRLAYERAMQVRKERYENLKREETRVLEKQSQGDATPSGSSAVPKVTFGEEGPVAPAKAPAGSVEKPAPAGKIPAAADPFEAEPRTAPATKPAVGEAASPSAIDDPFAPVPVATPKPAAAGAAKTDSGSAGTAPKPAIKKPAKPAAKGAKAADDAAGDDPFAASEPPAKPAIKKPAKPAAKGAKAADDAAGDDPFAASEPPAKPAVTKPAKPAAKGAKAADDAAGDDPFADVPAAKK